MKCLSCDNPLNDDESAYTFEHGEHIDLCQACLETTEIKAFPGNFWSELDNDEDYLSE